MLRHLRVVIDTNIWVSAFIGAPGAPFRIANGALAGEFSIVTSEPLLAELAEVLNRNRIARRHGHTREQIAVFVSDLTSISEVVPVTYASQGCRDPKDDIVVETALQGRADFLVSLDGDFLGSPAVVDALASIGARVLTPYEFVKELSSPTGPRPSADDSG